MFEAFDPWAILRALGGGIVIVAVIAGFAFLENQQRAKLFARLTKGSAFGWTRPARVMPNGALAAYALRPSKWTAVIPLGMIAVILISFLWPDQGTRTLSLLVLAGLTAWAAFILFSPDVVLDFKGRELRLMRWFRPPVLYDLAALQQIDPLDGDYAQGFRLVFNEGRDLDVSCQIGGVYDLAAHLTAFHPEAGRITSRVDEYLQTGE